MHGLRDARAAIDKKVETFLENHGCRVLLFNPCLWCCESERAGVLQNGDDFVAFRTRSQTLKFRDELGKELIVK